MELNPSINPHTGDPMVTGSPSKAYLANYDAIFRKPICPACGNVKGSPECVAAWDADLERDAASGALESLADPSHVRAPKDLE